MKSTLLNTLALSVALTANAGYINILKDSGDFAGHINTDSTELSNPANDLHQFVLSGLSWSAGQLVSLQGETLESFSFYVSKAYSPRATFRGVVTDATGAVLWESADQFASDSISEFAFSPGLAITSGAQYFVGVDIGGLTSASGDQLKVFFRSGNVAGYGNTVMYFEHDSVPDTAATGSLLALGLLSLVFVAKAKPHASIP